MLKLLIVSNLFPHSEHTVRAANIVVFELIRALARKRGLIVSYLIVRRHSDSTPSEIELQRLNKLSSLGIEVLEPILLPKPPNDRPAWLKLINSRRTDWYPDSFHANLVYQKIRIYAPDVIMIPWSEWLTALCAEFPIKKITYYGNPDHKAGIWRLAFDRRYRISKISWFRSKLGLVLLEKEHIRVMSKYDLIGDVAENDAKYYSKKGLKNVFYIQNIWIDRFGQTWQAKRQTYSKLNPVKIIASVGQLGGTANRYGLEILGRDLAPWLRELMGSFPYELHVIGGGELIQPLKKILNRPEIIIRGYVDDIDHEIIESRVFLCLNNASPFKVGHTRYLHAWSLGACVIAHEDASLSMPEMIHNQNCLLGRNVQEIARLIQLAIFDDEICLRLGKAGNDTFRKYFLADKVSDRIWQEINQSLLISS